MEQQANLFESLPLTEEQKYTSDLARAKATELFTIFFESGHNSREKSLAGTKLEEALMWFNKHLSRNP
jgi:hypothetical protein